MRMPFRYHHRSISSHGQSSGMRDKARTMTESPRHPVDLDLRMVRYFTVIAEHRHFGRAAAALRVAQSSLSRQVRRLEQDVGARLFDRTPQGTELTEAGEVFLPRARRCCARPPRRRPLRTPLPHPAASSSAIPPGSSSPRPCSSCANGTHADVRALHLAWDGPRRALLDHRADAVICRLPLETRGLHVTILYDEPQVLLVPRDHRLAARSRSLSTTSPASRCRGSPTRCGTSTGGLIPAPTGPGARWPLRKRS